MNENVFSYINGMNATFLEETYLAYLEDPSKVDASWRGFFAGMAFSGGALSVDNQDLRVIRLIEAYRRHGHKKALSDPLQEGLAEVPELSLSLLGFSPSDLSLQVPTFGFLPEKKAELGKLIESLEKRYCKGIGFEAEGGPSEELDDKVRALIEKSAFTLSKEDRLRILEDVMQAELFETFIHTKYPGQTRFSLEGGETFIPVLRFLLECLAGEGILEAVLGMAHRGRLNVLTSILGKSYAEIFEEFEGVNEKESSGDVKYHKGARTKVSTKSGLSIDTILASNPSHLESINPVVEGQVRAYQDQRGDTLAQKKSVAVLIHGDASLAGQGVIYETLQMSKLPGYETGGSLHIVINNHIGYTTLPEEGRSTLYCTDIAKAFGCPVFHVNAEKPIDCMEAVFLAVKIRQAFHIDVFIDLNCYRKYGHNEGDEPTFTQPLEYQKIKTKQSIRKILEEELLSEKMITEEEIAQKEKLFTEKLHDVLTKVIAKVKLPEEKKPEKQVYLSIKIPAVSIESLQKIAARMCEVPTGFTIYPKLQRIISGRLKAALELSEPLIDWGTAEHLAFGSLLSEKMSVRLSGQDVGRGTFSHRHGVWVDQKNGSFYVPLQHLQEGQGMFSLYNSPLSEFAVMGFDFGYSLAHSSCLVLWEAQYGDFYNGAQVIVDQYLSSAEQKWTRFSNLVLLLPHGYEGAGPEHSSGRIERFLQLCAEDNLIVADCTTPSQFFHLLRRQAYLSIKRPLIVFTPKALLRHPACVSSLQELAEGKFQECIDDPVGNKKVRKLLICTGRIYYDLVRERKERNVDDVAVLRIEQLYPFPSDALEAVLQTYPKEALRLWVQEEPINMGAGNYIKQAFTEHLGGYPLSGCRGRPESASPASGSYAAHKKRYARLMNEIFTDNKEEIL